MLCVPDEVEGADGDHRALARWVGASPDLPLDLGRHRLGLDVEDPGGSDDVPATGDHRPHRVEVGIAVRRGIEGEDVDPVGPSAAADLFADRRQGFLYLKIGAADGVGEASRYRLLPERVLLGAGVPAWCRSGRGQGSVGWRRGRSARRRLAGAVRRSGRCPARNRRPGRCRSSGGRGRKPLGGAWSRRCRAGLLVPIPVRRSWWSSLVRGAPHLSRWSRCRIRRPGTAGHLLPHTTPASLNTVP